MAVMVDTRTLRKEPVGGNPGATLKIEVKLGTAVDVLRDKDGFVEIRVPSLPGAPVGWVFNDAVDKSAVSVPPLDLKNLAEVVVEHADGFGVSAHFLISYAHMRSDLVPGQMANGAEHGPFGLSAAEWLFFGDSLELGVSFPKEAIAEWVSQSIVSALRMYLTQNACAEILGRQPTAAELALALMCGPKTAAAIIKSPAADVNAAIAANSAEDGETAGVDRAGFNLRFAEFLKGKTGQEAIDAITAKLQESLDATRQSIAALGMSTVANTETAVGGGASASVVIDISDEDMEALKRVAQSEVGHFKKHGMSELQGGLAAVVDTVFNRVAHRLFRNSIQDVINEENQFSAVNGKGSWTKLAMASAENADIVEAHVNARLGGAPSIIGGAVNFLNPFEASKKSMEKWGKFVVDTHVAFFGSIPKEDVHFHGSAPNSGKPKDYLLRRGGMSAHFSPDGILTLDPVTVLPPAAGGSSSAAGIGQKIVENALAELAFFDNGKRKQSEDPQFRRIGKYWKTIGQNIDGRTLFKNKKTGKLFNPAWSAAFISHVAFVSGGDGRFFMAEAHWQYVKDLLAGRPNPLYEVLPPDSHAPQPGDIVHFGRNSADRFELKDAKAAFNAGDGYESHCDIVVEVRPGKGDIVTIGGNVSDSVKETKRKIGADGKLLPRKDKAGNNLPWIAVLRLLP
jgi:spore germination cell wall hydrolase CwlJ-like protein